MKPRIVVLDDWTNFWGSQPAVEPLPADYPLTTLDNVVLTPNIGWGVDTNFRLMVENLTDAALKYLDGDMSGVVNPAALERRRLATT